MQRNVCIDNMLKMSLPRTWNSVKEQPNERVLSSITAIGDSKTS